LVAFGRVLNAATHDGDQGRIAVAKDAIISYCLGVLTDGWRPTVARNQTVVAFGQQVRLASGETITTSPLARVTVGGTEVAVVDVTVGGAPTRQVDLTSFAVRGLVNNTAAQLVLVPDQTIVTAPSGGSGKTVRQRYAIQLPGGAAKVDLGVFQNVAGVWLTVAVFEGDAPPPPQPSPSVPQSVPPQISTPSSPAIGEQVVDEAHFVSPSKNIYCFIGPIDKYGGDRRPMVRCDIQAKSWTPPPSPTECELDYGYAVQLQQGGRAMFLCAGDSVIADVPVLQYGTAVRVGSVVCVSQQVEMRCEDTSTGHGFTLSRQRYSMF
jgi:hypothetical protein